MQTIPLPLLLGAEISYQPLVSEISYPQSAIREFVSLVNRIKVTETIKITSYIPKQYFKILDNWIDNWDGLPFLWQNKVYALIKVETTYLNSGKSGNITVEMLNLHN
jgi:hypothetical protein